MFSTDASSETGMGGFLDGDYFAVTWDEIRTMRQKPCYPFTDGQASTIAFLELFAVYWALIRWGRRLEGFAVEIFIDNTAAMWWLRKERAPGSYGVLMREVHLLCIRYDIQLIPRHGLSLGGHWLSGGVAFLVSLTTTIGVSRMRCSLSYRLRWGILSGMRAQMNMGQTPILGASGRL